MSINVLFYVILGAVFGSVFLLILTFGLPVVLKRGPKSSMSKLEYYGPKANRNEIVIPSFYERSIIPFFTKIGYIVKRISPKGIVDSNEQRLMLAGLQEIISTDIYLAIKFLFPVVFLLISILVAIFFVIPLIMKIVLIAFVPLSFFLPDVFLSNKIAKRKRDIRRTLPNALDLLTISVEAGMGFDNAVAKVTNSIKGALSEEFARMLHEKQIGFSTREALNNLRDRTDVLDMNAFIMAVIHANTFGISIGKVLRVQASEMRMRRRQRAEEAGIKAPVKLVFPLIFCLFPALIAVILGPVVIRSIPILMETLFSR
ncbi:MAG: type II secretion system F family protein [Actinobacteria bacterium]|nr:type II secretion system F family protein [Actinomycetota bacterium]